MAKSTACCALLALGDHIDVRKRLQQPAQAGAYQGVIVDDDDSHGEVLLFRSAP